MRRIGSTLQFTEIGYNTWDYNRVYVFEVPYEIEMKDIEKHASELMYTDRHSTVAAYYFNFNSKIPCMQARSTRQLPWLLLMVAMCYTGIIRMGKRNLLISL